MKRTCATSTARPSAAARSSVSPKLATSGELKTQLGTTRAVDLETAAGDGVLRRDRALVVGPVREQRRPGDVAGGEHAVERRAQRLVDDDEAALVDRDAGLLEAHAAADRPAADAHQRDVGRDLAAVGEAQGEAVGRRRDGLDGGLERPRRCRPS